MERARLTVRMPPDLADRADAVAEQMGLSLNAFIVQAVRNWADYQGKRLSLSGPPAVAPARPSPSVSAPRPTAPTVGKVGPNQPCPCGSGQKYKRCHGKP